MLEPMYLLVGTKQLTADSPRRDPAAGAQLPPAKLTGERGAVVIAEGAGDNGAVEAVNLLKNNSALFEKMSRGR